MPDQHDLTRRDLLVVAAFVPLAALMATAQTGPAALTAGQMESSSVHIGWSPPMNSGQAPWKPAPIYIDRVLAGPNATKRRSSWRAGSGDAMRGTSGAPLADLPAEKRDLVLKAIDDNTARIAARKAILQPRAAFDPGGMFGDPYYGGNGASPDGI